MSINNFYFLALSALVLSEVAYGKGVMDIQYLSPRSHANKSLKIYHPGSSKALSPLVVHVCGQGFDLPFPKELTDFAQSRGWILMKISGLMGSYAFNVDELELSQAVAAVRRRYSVDPDRIYLVGWNTSGVLRCAYRTPSQYAAVAAASPYTDFSTYYRKFYGGSLYAPYQRAILANASTRDLMKNAEHLPTMLMIDSPDWVENETKKMIALFAESKKKSANPNAYTYQIIRSQEDKNKILAAYRFFDGKSRVKNPQHFSLTCRTLRYNRAYWGEILETASPYTPATLEVSAKMNTVTVHADGIRVFRLNITTDMVKDWGWDLGRPVKFIINKTQVSSGPAQITTYRLDRESKVWQVQTIEPDTGVLSKSPQNPGWISPLPTFQITYGTAGTEEENKDNKESAHTLSESYNAFYGADISPVPDTDFDPAQLGDIGQNLVMVGSSDSHYLIKQLKLPLQINREQVKILNKTYSPDHGVVAIYPNPHNHNLSFIFINNMEPDSWPYSWDTARWAWPDYVIFHPKSKTQTKSRLYETVTEGGFFPNDWNASIIKETAEEEPDIIPPWVEEWSPAPDARDVDRRPQILLRLRDAESGVDPESVSLFINDREITPDISETPGFLILTHTPDYDYPYGKKIRLEVVAQDMASNEMHEEIIFTIKLETLLSLRVNCGGGKWTDPDGYVWLKDQKYDDESWGHVRGQSFVNKYNYLKKTGNLGRIYRSERWGLDSYRFNLENRTYRIRMHFAEVYFSRIGRRVFDISVEGEPLIKDFDIYAEAGHGVATTLGVVAEVTDGRLDIDFNPSQNYAKISGIEIISSDKIYDERPPEISGWNPWSGAKNVPADAAVLVSITDDETGVDLNSIHMVVNGKEVKPDIAGNSFRYNLYWTPNVHFKYGKKITVIIGASDTADFPNRVNGINSFTIEPAPPQEE